MFLVLEEIVRIRGGTASGDGKNVRHLNFRDVSEKEPQPLPLDFPNSTPKSIQRALSPSPFYSKLTPLFLDTHPYKKLRHPPKHNTKPKTCGGDNNINEDDDHALRLAFGEIITPTINNNNNNNNNKDLTTIVTLPLPLPTNSVPNANNDDHHDEKIAAIQERDLKNVYDLSVSDNLEEVGAPRFAARLDALGKPCDVDDYGAPAGEGGGADDFTGSFLETGVSLFRRWWWASVEMGPDLVAVWYSWRSVFILSCCGTCSFCENGVEFGQKSWEQLLFVLLSIALVPMVRCSVTVFLMLVGSF